MKKILFSASVVIFLLSLGSVAKAQTTATSTLNVHISEQLKINFGDASGNAATGDVDLYFTKPEDYVTGVSAVKTGHLLITSTNNYTVDVKTQDAALAGLSGTNTNKIDASAVKVKLSAVNPTGVIGNTAGLNLSQSDGHFITSAPATTKTAINVEYFTDPGDSRFVGIAADTYTTKITYTLTAN